MSSAPSELATSLAKAEVALRAAISDRDFARFYFEFLLGYHSAGLQTSSAELVDKALAELQVAKTAFDEAYIAYTAAHDAIRTGVADEAEACAIHDAAKVLVLEASA
jgi:hypothetical protein